MPWNDSDKSKIAQYLGYDFSQGNLNLIAQAQQNCSAIGGEPALQLVQSHLRSLDSIWDELQAAAPYAGASFISSSGGSKQYFRGERRAQLQAQGNQLIQAIAQVLVLDIRRNLFSSGGTAQVVRG